MSIIKLSKGSNFNDFVKALIGTGQEVNAPQAKDSSFAFETLTCADDLRLDYDVTILPPKKYLLPQCEALLNFQVKGQCSSVIDQTKRILLGVHPYDMAAINQMDIIFSQDQYDSHYMTRRKNCTIIVCDVITPSENVFASSMGTAVIDKGFDIIITDIGDAYILEAATDKGSRLLELASSAEPAEQADLEKRSEIRRRNTQILNKHKLNCRPDDLVKLLEKAYDHPVWQEKGKLCYSCGSCTMVCPTCYCFDVQDQVNWDLKTGCRLRAWDGCLLENFATVAGNHNFRKERADRFRHRLYRKGKYVPQKTHGQTACVGCGRCIKACTAEIANPVEVYNRLLEDIKI